MALFDFFKRKTKPQPAPAAASPAPVAVAEPQAEPAREEIPDFLPDVGQGVATEHDGPERRSRSRRNARAGTRILVIDDSPTIVALLKRMLQHNHYDVLVAYDGETGIEVARREVPGLIFLDIVLPGVDGFNVLRTLRRDPATKNVPIIMISGNAQATEQFYVQRIGADDFMKKPFSRPEVFSRISSVLDENGVPRHVSRHGARADATKPATTP